MKTLIRLVCLLIALLVGTVAYAEEIRRRYAEVGTAAVSLSISSDGTAACYGEVQAKHQNTKIKATLTLKKSVNGKKWSTVRIWSASGSGLFGVSISETCSVSKGYQYKLTMRGRIYDASENLLGFVSQTSAIHTY